MLPASTLPLINHARELLMERGMGILGAWALLNLLVSGYYVARTDRRSKAHHFHLMNVAWNMLNALLAVWGILQAHPQQVAGLTLTESLAAQARTEQIVLLSIAFDAGCVVAGLWLRRRALSAAAPERLEGFGRSVLLQGAFLVLFDTGLYLAYHPYAARLLAAGA